VTGAGPCTTGKARFPTQHAAKTRLAEIRANPDPARMYEPCATIHCRKCDGWHLTSRSPKVWKKAKTVKGHRR
jgi:hypothetical protein